MLLSILIFSYRHVQQMQQHLGCINMPMFIIILLWTTAYIVRALSSQHRFLCSITSISSFRASGESGDSKKKKRKHARAYCAVFVSYTTYMGQSYAAGIRTPYALCWLQIITDYRGLYSMYCIVLYCIAFYPCKSSTHTNKLQLIQQRKQGLASETPRNVTTFSVI